MATAHAKDLRSMNADHSKAEKDVLAEWMAEFRKVKNPLMQLQAAIESSSLSKSLRQLVEEVLESHKPGSPMHTILLAVQHSIDRSVILQLANLSSVAHGHSSQLTKIENSQEAVNPFDAILEDIRASVGRSTNGTTLLGEMQRISCDSEEHGT